MVIWGRVLRNIKAWLGYPLWLLRGALPPDNHIHKRNRIHKIANKYDCQTFIETGTFYGQMTNAVKGRFKKVLTVELFEPLYNLNTRSFFEEKNIKIYLGNSSSVLIQMIDDAEGRILFWLDGHYSGEGTGIGLKVSPIIDELNVIRNKGCGNHCILIDDARLFTGKDGYPTLQEACASLREINQDYEITVDGDCILALPVLNSYTPN